MSIKDSIFWPQWRQSTSVPKSLCLQNLGRYLEACSRLRGMCVQIRPFKLFQQPPDSQTCHHIRAISCSNSCKSSKQRFWNPRLRANCSPTTEQAIWPVSSAELPPSCPLHPHQSHGCTVSDTTHNFGSADHAESFICSSIWATACSECFWISSKTPSYKLPQGRVHPGELIPQKLYFITCGETCENRLQTLSTEQELRGLASNKFIS